MVKVVGNGDANRMNLAIVQKLAVIGRNLLNRRYVIFNPSDLPGGDIATTDGNDLRMDARPGQII